MKDKLKLAFNEYRKLELAIERLQERQRMILKVVPKPYKSGQRIRTRDDMNRIAYWHISESYAHSNNAEKTIGFNVWGVRITKGGAVRGRFAPIPRRLLKTAELIK